ncbi:GIN domain-containing protein [Arenibacter aquaticus]|uniref:GIN domain-containing protein n=1 Tax=Arenibacter aquaticus TaxID=2489054 RepID=UPI00130499C3|nr:DUF2807 domain-containing protein [Arenibacter aquaticus]
MKHSLLFFLLAVCCIGYSQRKPKIKGNRNVVEVKETLPPFNAIQLNDDLEITLQSSSVEGYTIEADDNLIDILNFKVEDEILIIGSYYKVTGKKKLDITVNFNRLNEVSVYEGKLVAKDGFVTDMLQVSTFGSAEVDMDVNTEVMYIAMEGNSRGDFKIDSDSLNISLMGKAKLGLYGVIKTAEVVMTQNSDADLEGITENLGINLFDNADLKAKRLEANLVEASLEGNASVEVWCTNELQLNSEGSAKTYMYGDGKISLLQFLDTSELYKRKN